MSGFEADPTGDLIDVIAYFYYTVTTSEKVCPSLSHAITAALGALPYLELAGTLVFGGLLAALCLLKPSAGHEGSGLMTLLKGAAMDEIDKKILAIEEKLGMTNSGYAVDQDKEEQKVSRVKPAW